MKGALYCLLLLALLIVCLVSEPSRALTLTDVHHAGAELSPWSSKGPLKSDEGFGKMHGDAKITEDDYMEGGAKIGSAPPNCENKCFGCIPCEAIQIATPSVDAHIHVQYSNYKPIIWICKCGPSFYTP